MTWAEQVCRTDRAINACLSSSTFPLCVLNLIECDIPALPLELTARCGCAQEFPDIKVVKIETDPSPALVEKYKVSDGMTYLCIVVTNAALIDNYLRQSHVHCLISKLGSCIAASKDDLQM